MKIITYSLATQTFPPGFDIDGFRKLLLKAFDYLSRASGGRLSFVPSAALTLEKLQLGAQVWKRLAIGFDSFAQKEPPKLGDYRVHNTTESIAFNVAVSWATRWWHFWSEPIYPVIVHELGHAIGLQHVEEWDSVMHPTSDADKLTERDVFALQRLLA